MPAISKKLAVRGPVRRHNAQTYLLIFLLIFCLTVILTRLFLTLTGFPKIGNGELHIAHLLWGGLGLFIATLLLLTLANRWAYVVGALCGGFGVGMFIDEVGKFITQSNDYFYPLAIPIIYSVVLLTFFIYLEVRRPFAKDSRSEMYRALEMLQELLDRDLDSQERDELEKRLQGITTQTDNPDLAALAQTLSSFLQTGTIQLATRRTDDIGTILLRRTNALLDSLIRRPRFIKWMAVAFLVIGITVLPEPAIVIFQTLFPADLTQLIQQVSETGLVRSANSLNWYYARLVSEGVIGILLILSAILLWRNQTKRGIELGYIGLLLSLTVVNLLVFYYDQFGNIVLTLIESGLLFLLLRYRQNAARKAEETSPAVSPQVPSGLAA